MIAGLAVAAARVFRGWTHSYTIWGIGIAPLKAMLVEAARSRGGGEGSGFSEDDLEEVMGV